MSVQNIAHDVRVVRDRARCNTGDKKKGAYIDRIPLMFVRDRLKILVAPT